MTLDEVSGLWYRENSQDLAELRKKRKWYEQVPLREDDVVLEIGAFIGSFTDYAAERVAKVVAYEPIRSSFEVALANTCDLDNVFLHHAAVVGGSRSEAVLYVNKGKWLQGASGYVTKDCSREIAPAVRFSDVVRDADPTVLSMDCEGGEYDTLLYHSLPERVRMIDLEIHVRKKEWRKTTAYQLMAQLRATGFESSILPPIKKHWAEMSIKTLWFRA